MTTMLMFTGPVTFATGSVTITLDNDLTPALAARLDTLETNTMTALEDLQAADTALDAQVAALIAEQATFLTDIAAALAAAGTDPAAVEAVVADLNDKAAQLQALTAAQVAADPATPPPAA